MKPFGVPASLGENGSATVSRYGSSMNDGAAVRDCTVYEHPLNERVRTLLRLEFLFGQGEFGYSGDTPWHSRAGVNALIDVMGLLSRGDLRKDVQKELDRVTGLLEGLEESPGVDASRLAEALSECRSVSERFQNAGPLLGARLRDNELLAAIGQRLGIIGGTCAFDLPGYHHWLQQPARERRRQLEDWFADYGLIREATDLLLWFLRDSAHPRRETAPAGMYQASLDRNQPYQLLRVLLPADAPYFPEISGTRHFVTLRFMHQDDMDTRPRQSQEDVDFLLERCAI